MRTGIYCIFDRNHHRLQNLSVVTGPFIISSFVCACETFEPALNALKLATSFDSFFDGCLPPNVKGAVHVARSHHNACTMASTATNSSKFKRVCVYCGSSSGNSPAFLEAAAQLGEELVSRGVGLVYGGGSVGLMGKVSSTVFVKGGSVLGVIPVALQPVELSGESIGDVVVVSDMHERKALMVGSFPLSLSLSLSSVTALLLTLSPLNVNEKTKQSHQSKSARAVFFHISFFSSTRARL